MIAFASYIDRFDSVPSVVSDSFEKDDDSNFHVDFLHAMTNLRARNYGLEEYDWLQVCIQRFGFFADASKVKLKAGRIIPALVTTTAVVAGLVGIQFLQVVASVPVEKLKNSFVNLAVPYIAQSEPGPPPTRKITPEVWIHFALFLRLAGQCHHLGSLANPQCRDDYCARPLCSSS